MTIKEEPMVAPQPTTNGVTSNGAHENASGQAFAEGPCTHQAKKSLINSKSVRTAMKKGQPNCFECARKEEESKSALSFCLACGVRFCEAHAMIHSKAPRSGDYHSLYLDETTHSVRCLACEVTVNPEDSLFIKMLLNELKSFMKIKSRDDKAAEKAASNEEKPAVLDKPQPKPEKKPPMNGHSSENGLSPEKQLNGLKKSSSSSDRSESSHANNNGYANGTGSGERSKNGICLPGNTAIPAKGLSNLGNTCFFNSVMQCMLHTHQLAFYFERFGRVSRIDFIRPSKPVVVNDEKVELEEATLSIPAKCTPLNDALSAFVVDFRNGRSPSPSNLFNQIAYKAVRFRSMAQQDAHELLRYLLDGLCSEETARYQEAIAALVGAPVKSAARVDKEVARKAKGYLQLAGRPLLDAVFGGRLLQTIRCSKCHHVSERYENMYDLSVPLTGSSSNSSRSTRSSFGGVTATNPSSSSSTRPSKHQMKKEAAAAKKARKGSRSLKSQESKTGEDEVQDVNDKLDDLRLDGGSDEEGEEEGKENGVNGKHEEAASSSGNESDNSSYRPEEKAVDPLDLTKVLTTMKTSLPSGQSIAASLLEFTAEERLEGANAYECEKCCTPVNKKKGATGAAKTRVEATKRYLIITPPVVLTIHVKRFQQIHVGQRVQGRKVPGHVAFPLIFDIAPFCCKNVQRISPGQTSILYSLYGVVVHSGNIHGGHYVAYVKSRERIPQSESMLEAARSVCADVNAEPLSLSLLSSPSGAASTVTTTPFHATPEEAIKDVPGGTWYFCSDSRVSAVSESKVLQEEAYLLFYERIY